MRSNDPANYEKLDFYLHAIQESPKEIENYIACARLYLEMGRRKEAFKCCAKALIIDPIHPLLYSFLLHEYYGNFDFDVTLKFLDDAISDYPNAAFLYAERAQVFKELNQFDEAILDFNHAIRLDPTCAEYWYGRYEAKKAMALDEQALADLMQAIQLEPDNIDYLLARGRYYLDRQYFLKAAIDYGHVDASFLSNIPMSTEFSMLVYLVKEFEELKGNDACVYGFAKDDIKFNDISHDIKELLTNMKSKDQLISPSSLFTVVGMFVNRRPELLARKPELISDIQEKLGFLPK